MLNIYLDHLLCLEKVNYATAVVTACMEAVLIEGVLLDLRKRAF